MRIGIDSYSYHRLLGEVRPGEDDPGERLTDGGLDVIAEARALGVEGVSLETCFLGPPERLDVRALRERAGPLELVLAWGAPNGLEFGANAAALDDLLGWIDLGAWLGSRLMRIVIAGPSLRGLEPVATQIGRTVTPLRHACERARERRLILAVENHGDLSAAQLEELLEQVGVQELGICFDTANALRVGDDPVAAARLLAPHVRMVHLKDVEPMENVVDPVAGPHSVEYGMGVVPLEKVLDVLATAGFDGLVCVELGQIGTGDVERKMVAQGVEWLRTQLEVGR